MLRSEWSVRTVSLTSDSTWKCSWEQVNQETSWMCRERGSVLPYKGNA